MSAVVVLFTRDLRIRDNPALAEAARRGGAVVPLAVLDEAILGRRFASTNRVAFLVEALDDLRKSLRRVGGDLILRRGDPVAKAISVAGEVGATAIFASEDVTAYAKRRARRLERACEQARMDFVEFPGITVVPSGSLRPSGGGDHYRVFTPYWRAWLAEPKRAIARTPRRISVPDSIEPGILPTQTELVPGRPSPHLPAGGESAGRRRLAGWIRSSLPSWNASHDDLDVDIKSRLSPFLHFGCLSPLEVALRADKAPFLRQLCWRDFHHQVADAFPAIARDDYRPRGDRWHRPGENFNAWREGRTGYPIVDAGMRQLLAEGWMHNRARLIVASFLTKDLLLDWRLGAQHFFDLLVDGDVANNAGNWQWVAGTGNDTRPNRVLNPLRQAARFDPTGAYVRRYVHELASIDGADVHRPWLVGSARRHALGYPAPLVDHNQAVGQFRHGRGLFDA